MSAVPLDPRWMVAVRWCASGAVDLCSLALQRLKRRGAPTGCAAVGRLQVRACALIPWRGGPAAALHIPGAGLRPWTPRWPDLPTVAGGACRAAVAGAPASRSCRSPASFACSG